jgi:O-antigen/teichoic acid export membrane protein
LQLSKHIGKAAWSTADKLLYVLIGLAFILPRKMIGETDWGVYVTVQAMLTSIFMLSDGLSLQAMVNFGMETHRRRQALTVSGLTHLLFIGTCTAIVYFGRAQAAELFNEPRLVATLALFPLMSGGFLLRNYFLKVSQLHIDTRATFLIDAAWIGTTVGLIAYGHSRRSIVATEDMIVISAIASGVSSLAGLLLYGTKIRFTTALDRAYTREMLRFGLTQFGSALTLAVQSVGDALILKPFTTSAAVGNYDAAKSVFRGFEAIRDAGSLFVYPAIAKLKSQGRDQEMVLLVEKMIGFTLIVVVPMVVFVWVGPTDEIFNLIYRGKYQLAPTLFKMMSLAALAIPFSMNMSVLSGLGDARRFLRATVVAAATSLVTAALFVPWLGAYGSALTLVISYTTLGIMGTWMVRGRVPFSIVGALGRWRDALDFAMRAWRGKRGRG